MIEEVKKACEVLRDGGIILYPTDTVWGIGCDATNKEAVEKIYRLKRRTDRKSMLVLVDGPSRLETYVDNIPDIAWQLIEVADAPLTIIYDKGRNLASNLMEGDGSIGIRVTGEAFSRALCERFNKPVVSTSANISGEPSPSCYADISPSIVDGVDYAVNYRRDERSAAPSSIIRLGAGGLFEIIR
ncbi:MAG: threonylcarbamoyl-AMP synthase [Tannerellaceae bacterium]|jgi:L-threonylcarbamoyladenylate synthase|nr:threonylcarbamoyl-AMP synthase [Tannerellaceae bacterium]